MSYESKQSTSMDNEKRARFLSSNNNNDPKIGKVKFLELRLQSHQNVNSTIFTFITSVFFLFRFSGMIKQVHYIP